VYEPTNEPREFIADSRQAAVAKASEFFGVAGDALSVAELRAGEVSGLGSRVVVVAVPRDRKPSAPRPDRGDRGDRGDRDRGERGRGGRRRSEASGRGERRDREPRREREPRRGRESRRGREEREEAAEPEPAAEPTVATVEGELGRVGEFVKGVLERMDLGPFRIAESGEADLLAVSIGGPAAPRLSGSDGRAVDALQLLANQAASQLDDDPPRVVIEVEGDTEAREERLARLAERVAGRARETGRSVRLDPMNGRDRRVIHLALRDVEGVATMSTGEGPYRQVVVVPEGAPEFEAAQRESQRAERENPPE